MLYVLLVFGIDFYIIIPLCLFYQIRKVMCRSMKKTDFKTPPFSACFLLESWAVSAFGKLNSEKVEREVARGNSRAAFCF